MKGSELASILIHVGDALGVILRSMDLDDVEVRSFMTAAGIVTRLFVASRVIIFVTSIPLLLILNSIFLCGS